jgi:diguanylate cyclase (GGDEF)-like protein
LPEDTLDTPDTSVDLYETVFRVGATLIADLELETVLATVARQVGETMRATSCDITDYDPAVETLTYAALWARETTPEDEEYVGTVTPIANRPARLRVVREREVVEYYLDDPELDPIEREIMETWGESTALEAPLVFADEVIGILGVIDADPQRRYTDTDKALLQALAVPVAAAIHNARAFAASRERRRRLGGLLDATRAVTSASGLDEMLAVVAREAAELLGCPECLIYEYDAERHGIVWRTHYHGDAVSRRRDQPGVFYSAQDWPGDYDIMMGGEICADHVDDPELTDEERAFMLENGEISAITVPLRFGDTPIGILYLVETSRRRELGARETELASAFGELASAAIHNARLFDLQEQRSERLRSLFGAGRSIIGTPVIDDLVLATCDQAAKVLAGDSATVRVWLRDAGGALVPWGEGAEQSVVAALPPAAEQAVATLAPAQEPCEPGTRLVLPFAVRGRAEGFMEIVDESRRAFREDLVEELRIVANHAAAAVANARLYALVETQAITDGLTGLYNHRHFYERLEAECARARRYGLPLSLLMIDIDDFKRFNDHHGHQRGDQVLRDVAEILTADTRHNIDLPARYGGEEFAVILPHTVLEGAGVVGDRIHRQVVDLGSPRPNDDALPPQGENAAQVGERLRHDIEQRALATSAASPRVTVSVGAASLAGAAATPELVVNCADKALYLAKRAGKNRVEVYR